MSNIGAAFLVDVCERLQNLEFIPDTLLCLNYSTAEKEVIAYIKRTTVKGE